MPDFLKDNWWIIAIVVVVMMMNRGGGGGGLGGILDMILELLGIKPRPRPEPDSEHHVHDMRTVEGRVCAADCLAKRLEAAGDKATADALLASIGKLLR